MSDDCEIIYSQNNFDTLKSDYEKQLSFLKKQLDEARNYCSQKDKTISEFQIQTERLKLELDESKTENNLLSKKLKEKQENNAKNSEKDLNKALIELTNTQDKNVMLTQENKKFIELVAAQKKEIEKGFEMVKKLNNDIHALKIEIAKKNPIILPQPMPQPQPLPKNKAEEILIHIKKNLKDLHHATKDLYEDIESRIEVIKLSEVDKKSESLKQAYEADFTEVKDKIKEIMFFKDIAEGALI